MKAKDWIINLQKLDPEKEVYLHYTHNGEDWGYSLNSLQFDQKILELRKFSSQKLIYEDNGEGDSLGLCNVIKIY